MDHIGPVELLGVAFIAIIVASAINALFAGPSCREHTPSPATPVTFMGLIPAEWTNGPPREQEFSVKVTRCAACAELQFFCMTILPGNSFMTPCVEDIAFAAAPEHIKKELWKQYRHQKRIARKRDVSTS